MSDYRNTPLCKNLSNVKSKKEDLQATILLTYPGQKNIYRKVNDKKLSLRNKRAYKENVYNH